MQSQALGAQRAGLLPPSARAASLRRRPAVAPRAGPASKEGEDSSSGDVRPPVAFEAAVSNESKQETRGAGGVWQSIKVRCTAAIGHSAVHPGPWRRPRTLQMCLLTLDLKWGWRRAALEGSTFLGCAVIGWAIACKRWHYPSGLQLRRSAYPQHTACRIIPPLMVPHPLAHRPYTLREGVERHPGREPCCGRQQV